MKQIKLGLIAICALILVFLLASSTSTPANPLYPLKRLEEKTTLSFKTDPESTLDYMLVLADERLNELSAVVNDKKYRYVLKASLRYSTQVGEIVNLVKSNNLQSRVVTITEKLKVHKGIIESLYANYPDPNDTERKFVLDDINYLKIYLMQLR